MIAMATIAAAGVAQARFQRETTNQAPTTSAAGSGISISARIGCRTRPNSTPASMALASDDGIVATALRRAASRGPSRPSATPTTRNAPTAAPKPPSTAPVAASSAAPGVDQAPEIGIL